MNIWIQKKFIILSSSFTGILRTNYLMTNSQLPCQLNCRIPASPNCNDFLFFCLVGASTTSIFNRMYVLLVLTCCPGRPCCPCSPGGPWVGKVSQRRHYINFHTLSYSNGFDFISGFLFFFTNLFPTMQSFFTRHIHCLKLTLNYFVKKLHCLQFFIPWRLCFSIHHFHKDHNAHCLPHILFHNHCFQFL